MQRSVIALALATQSASAKNGELSREEAVVWRDEWSRFRLWQYIATPAIIGASLYVGLGMDFPSDGSREGFLFDDPLRDAFVADSRAGRDRARLVGDISWRTLTVYPLLVEPIAVAWVAHGSSDVAAQMFLINLQSFSWTALLSLVPQHFIGRARPSTTPCDEDPQYEAFCGGKDRFASFPSGHTSIAATGATLMCVHNEHLPLYGGGLGDRIVCYVAIAGAVATGAARLVNDRHYATDILAGAALGAASGYVVPKWLHYGFGQGNAAPEQSDLHWMLAPLAGPGVLGVSFAAVR